MAQSRDETVASNKEFAATAAIRKSKKADIETDEPSTRQLVVGNMGTRYGLDEIQSIKVPSKDDFAGQVTMCRKLYVDEGVIKTVIDLMVDFSVTGMKNVTEHKKSKKFFDTLCKYSDMDSLLRWIFFEYYMSGDVVIYRGEQQTVQYGEDIGKIYFPYTVLNPLSVQIEGSMLFNDVVITMILPDNVKLLLADPKRYKKLIAELPPEFRNPRFSEQGNLILDPTKLGRICRGKQPYQRRPTPFLTGAFQPTLLKRRLREMDLATAEGTINSLQVIKVGNDKYPATPKQLKALAELFQTGAKSYQIFWNHTLEIENKTADLSALSDEKYKQINRDILSSLGMPVVLINGGEDGGRFANAWASIVALIERLEAGRRQVKRWLESEYRILANEFNLEAPAVEFDRMNLKEERVFKDILMAYYDRGLLDVETMLDDTGFDYDIILQRKKDEEKDSKYWESPFEGPAPVPPKPPTTKQGGEGRPKNELNPKYTERPPQEGPKMKDYDLKEDKPK